MSDAVQSKDLVGGWGGGVWLVLCLHAFVVWLGFFVFG